MNVGQLAHRVSPLPTHDGLRVMPVQRGVSYECRKFFFKKVSKNLQLSHHTVVHAQFEKYEFFSVETKSYSSESVYRTCDRVRYRHALARTVSGELCRTGVNRGACDLSEYALSFQVYFVAEYRKKKQTEYYKNITFCSQIGLAQESPRKGDHEMGVPDQGQSEGVQGLCARL